MRSIPKWANKIEDADKNAQCVYDLCFHPKGNLIVAAGLQVLVYSLEDGSLLQALKGHKENVYCVCCTKDGKKLASGSADKTVIIWNSKFEGILKYSHNDAVQCLAYNPTSSVLASCSLSDFALWSQEQKSVQKYKTVARINACSWTNDGQYLALGLGNGSVSIRNTLGEEKGRIDRPGGFDAAIWSLQWCPNKDDGDILCVTDWNKNIAFYTLGGKLVGRERSLDFEPLRVSYFPKGEYILVTGTNKACSLMTKDGIKLGNIGDVQNHWIWCCAADQTSNFVAIGCQDGTLAFYQLIVTMVHGLYQERYAFRENMTDVIIQHLMTDQKVRIKCRDLIKKIAIYRDRLAVQLPERIVIYELNPSEPESMHYKVREKINQRLECSLLVVCSEQLVVCQERRLLGLTFSGEKYREWMMDSSIRYIKVAGGSPGKEGLLLGLKSGQIWKIYINDPIPMHILTVTSPIRCLDLNCQRTKIAVVDDNWLLQVYEMEGKELLYTEHDTNSVAWNTKHENLLSFSSDKSLGIRLENYPAHRRCQQGLVVGFTGNKAFCLQDNIIISVQLPISATMYQCIDKKQFKEAYRIAHLGVTHTDWEELGSAALEHLELDIAQKSYMYLQDIHYLNLINDLKDQKHKGENNQELLKAQVLAFRGRFKEAARLYQRSGNAHRAVTMYTNLRMFDLAQDFIGVDGNVDNKNLIRQKAEWAKNINEPKAAAELYLSIGDTRQAIEIMAEHNWVDMLEEVGKRLDKADRTNLVLVAENLRRLDQTVAAGELYRRLGDESALLTLYVEAHQWAQAFALAEKQPEHKHLVYVPYAQWLAENDKFSEAQIAFHKAGRPEEAFKVLKQLTENAINEKRFQDASYLHWILARQCLELAANNEQDCEQNIRKFYENERLSSIYYAYHTLYQYIEQPFTSYIPEALFNIARFVLNEIKNFKPKGISEFTVLYSFSKQAKILGANRLCRQLLDKLRLLRIPSRFQEQVEISTLAAYTKPHNDPEDLLPMCYRCSTYNPLIGEANNICSHCQQPFVHSYVSFEVLPLIEFQLESDITDDEAVRLIQAPVDEKSKVEHIIDETQVSVEIEDNSQLQDSFTIKLTKIEEDNEEFVPITVNRATLKSMDPSTVLICKWPRPLRYQFYRNLLPDLQITLCHSCFKTFHVDDYELQILQKNHCPFCRTPTDISLGEATPELDEILEFNI